MCGGLQSAQVVIIFNFICFYFCMIFMLLPHEWYIQLNKPKTLSYYIRAGVQSIRKFWDSVRSGVHYQTHPIRDRTGHQRWAIPLRFHGDGTPVVSIGKTWSKMMDIWFALVKQKLLKSKGLFLELGLIEPGLVWSPPVSLGM